MNKCETLKGYKDWEFRRITGVKRATFDKMANDSGSSVPGQAQEARQESETAH
jgi:hypothetical protein